MSASAIQRFENEAPLIARLNHPRIVPIDDVCFHGPHRYFTMLLFSGGSLSDHVSRLAQTPRDSAALLVKVAEAIHYAHQRGILHRDLKPSNVLLDEFGRPYVSDFGRARLLDQDSALTLSHEVIGTPAFMAPEQAAQDNERTTKLTRYAADMLLADMARRSGDSLQFGNLLARHIPVAASLRGSDPSADPAATEDVPVKAAEDLAFEVGGEQAAGGGGRFVQGTGAAMLHSLERRAAG